ncbi:YoaK family protein [Kitasatospora sp. NPDC048540]|uniref:YoaK family protein n=1 Tax=unclassified Kitasatospora TaxID=2633591 RepID=UPI000539768B|nr:YoaK family protein [Kitasatospora sp. MBT63]
MASVWEEIRETVAPRPGSRHGPLPPLLLALTVVGGLVDAVSFLGLGHVFVANVTGSVVVVGFAAAGAKGFSVSSSLVSLTAFLVGAALGGRIGRRLPHRGRVLLAALSVQTALFGSASAVSAWIGTAHHPAGRYTILALLALAMGLQNAAVRLLAVPDLTTTAITMTLVGLAADGPLGAGGPMRAGPRLLSATALLSGAFAGGFLVLRHGVTTGMTVMSVVAALTVVAVAAAARHPGVWADRP